MQWCNEKIELQINSSQNTFLFRVKLSDYHSRMKRAASRSSAIINFDATNWRQFFSCHMQSAHKTYAVKFMAPVSGACVRGFTCDKGFMYSLHCWTKFIIFIDLFKHYTSTITGEQ